MNRYFSFDEEFSGLKDRKNCLVSIGAVEVIEKDGVFQIDNSRQLYIELKPTGDIDPESMKINGLDVENLKVYGVSKAAAIKDIKKFLNLQPGDTAVFVAYCGVLDKIYIDHMYEDELTENPFHYEIIELSSLAIGKLGFEWGFSEKDLLEKLNIQELDESKKHNALQDAILQAKEFCGIMNFRG
jgi:ribonuclease T